MSIPPFSIALPTIQTDGSTVWLPFDANFIQPHSVQHTPPVLANVDNLGIPQLQAYGRMTWTYKHLSLTEWQYIMAIYRQTRNTQATPLWSMVRIQWPDPQTHGNVSASARFEPVQTQTRGITFVQDFTLTFAGLGFDDARVTGTWVPLYR